MPPKKIRNGKGTCYRLYVSASCPPTSPKKTATNPGFTNPTHFNINCGFPPLGSAHIPLPPRVGPQTTSNVIPAVGPSNASGPGSQPVSPYPVRTSPKNRPSSVMAAAGPTPNDDRIKNLETPQAGPTNRSESLRHPSPDPTSTAAAPAPPQTHSDPQSAKNEGAAMSSVGPTEYYDGNKNHGAARSDVGPANVSGPCSSLPQPNRSLNAVRSYTGPTFSKSWTCIPHSAASAEEEEELINKILYGDVGGKKKRLPVFRDICPD